MAGSPEAEDARDAEASPTLLPSTRAATPTPSRSIGDAQYSTLAKVGVAGLLAVQNSVAVLTLRYSKTVTQYNSLSTVLIGEVLKCVACCAILYFQHCSLSALGHHLAEKVLRSPGEMLRCAVPALLFLLQNCLLFFAIGHLDAAFYMIATQGKILTTALFSVAMLGKQLQALQWHALVILTLGVVFAQYQPADKVKASDRQSQMLGLGACAMSWFTSAFASVYIEKMLKQTGTDLWTRNIQLALWSLVSGFIVIVSTNSAPFRRYGLWLIDGYTTVVWAVAVLQGVSGLLISVVMKVADNIVKCFATAVALLLTILASMLLFGFEPSIHFAFGSILVVASVVMYSWDPATAIACPTHCDALCPILFPSPLVTPPDSVPIPTHASDARE